MVIKEWQSISQGNSPMETWKKKIRHLRSFSRGWVKNISSVYKKDKERLMALIDSLDKKAESQPLSLEERKTMRKANDNLAKLRHDEETKWA
jgi:hypothetical protein